MHTWNKKTLRRYITITVDQSMCLAIAIVVCNVENNGKARFIKCAYFRTLFGLITHLLSKENRKSVDTVFNYNPNNTKL